ncbi:MAG: peroxiredoxin [Gammaproteobacteria bacterium]|nr:MAG: peroxiredoxin [Gammaproteobacteria bacterium]
MTTISIDEKIPDFEANATGDNLIKLPELKGKNVVLYFYPKDNTPGCTQEGQDFRDHYTEFEALDTLIFGISRDSLRIHENFKAKHQFPFELISDTEEQLCELFGVIKMKNMYGKKVRGIERSTFLIDKNGALAAEWRKVKVKVHIEEVLQTLREINN